MKDQPQRVTWMDAMNGSSGVWGERETAGRRPRCWAGWMAAGLPTGRETPDSSQRDTVLACSVMATGRSAVSLMAVINYTAITQGLTKLSRRAFLPRLHLSTSHLSAGRSET